MSVEAGLVRNALKKKERKKGKNTVDKSIYLLGFFRYRSSHRRCSVKKVFLEISQNS